MLESFKIFTKIRRDIRKSRYTTSINNICGKFATRVSYTSGKFATGVNNNGVNFPVGTTGVVDTNGQFSEVGGPQIANLQICELIKFVTFADLLQMWQFADLRFAYPIFCNLRTQIFLWT
jgi:hypothetical protein